MSGWQTLLEGAAIIGAVALITLGAVLLLTHALHEEEEDDR